MKPYHHTQRKEWKLTTEKSSRLMKTVLTNLGEDLEKEYENPNWGYEFLMIMSTGKLPPIYRAVRILASSQISEKCDH